MAESDNDSFILIDVDHQNGHKTIQQQVMFDHAQLTKSIISNGCGSVDGWSEVSAPSIKSFKSAKSMPTKASIASTLHVLDGTYLQSPMISIPGFKMDAGSNSDKGYHFINSEQHSQENMVIFSSNSTTEPANTHNTDNNLLNIPPIPSGGGNHKYNSNRSVGSVGSRVPFSWAEITKIQPQFHDDKEIKKPKVFDQTPKIQTRYRAEQRNRNKMAMQQKQNIAVGTQSGSNLEDENPMPAIPESDPFATKSDLGRRIRRSGKRGSRLRYPNGKKGGKRNARKRNQK